MKLLNRLRGRLPSFRMFRRWRMVRHVRMVARIRDTNPSNQVKAACKALLRALVDCD